MLTSFYDENEVPESDRIPLEKEILLVVPEKGFDIGPVVSALGLSPYEVAVTYPKSTVEMFPEVCAAEARLVIQVGKQFSRKFHFVPDADGAKAFRDKALSLIPDTFVGLHHHDEFSIKDGLGTVKQLVRLLAAQRRSFCCVTNHGSVGGWIRQYNACKKSGVKAIFGMEAYTSEYRGDDPEEKKKHRSANHLVLIARTKEGFDNIIRIHNDAWMNGFYYSPRANREACQKWGKGIVATSACMAGEIPRAVMGGNIEAAKDAYQFYSSVFDKFYIELQIIEYEAQRVANRKLIEFAQSVGAPVILACDSHYLEPEMSETHDVLMCIRQYKTIMDLNPATISEPEPDPEPENDSGDNDPEEEVESQAETVTDDGEEKAKKKVDGEKPDVWAFDVRNLYYRNADQMRQVFRNGYEKNGKRLPPFKDDIFTEEVFRQAMENTRLVAVDCETIKLDSAVQLPKLYPDGDEILRKKANDGFIERGLQKKKNYEEYRDRMIREFAVIGKLGWIDYFLVMDKIISLAKVVAVRMGINPEFAIGYGRGSAGGSLVSYCLGLTDIDPIQYGLLFERFLDEGRPDPPDIDTDFDPRIREEVKREIVEAFGHDNVCSIGTYQTYKTKAVILDVARALNENVGEANAVTKKIDSLTQFEDEEGESHKVDDIPFDELCEYYPELGAYFKEHERLRYHAEILRNQVKNIGTHAGGVIISDRSLKDKIPVLWDKPGNKIKRKVISAWAEGQDKSELSSVGLVKFDILGLANLPVIADCIALIEKNRGIKIKRKDIPIDDKASIVACSKGDLVGIFQLENPATMPVVEAVGMESLNDVSAITSLIRPGPRDMGMDMEYAERKHGKPYEVIPCIRHVMAETYGVMTYQEQAMKISQVLCGFDGPMANKLRKAIGKKIKALMDEMRGKFMKGAHPKIASGEVTREEVESVFNLIETFAGYGFNKSHAVAYSAISTVELWLKYHYFIEYVTSLINNSKLGKKKHGKDIFTSYVNYARRKEVKVLGPDISKSKTSFTIEDGAIRFSLSHIKYVAKQAAVIESFQPFTGMKDFYERVKVEKVGKNGKKTTSRQSKRVVESLIAAGAFDAFGDRNQMTKEYHECRKKKDDKLTLHTDSEWVALEQEMIGLCLSKPPLLLAHKDVVKENGWQNIASAGSKKKVTVFGRIEDVVPHKSKTGNSMDIVTLSDDIDTMKFFVFQAARENFRHGKVKARKGMMIAVPLDHFTEEDGKISETAFLDDRRDIQVLET